jgi:hypothetical protein
MAAPRFAAPSGYRDMIDIDYVPVVAVPDRRKSWLARVAANEKARLNQMKERRRVCRELDGASGC